MTDICTSNRLSETGGPKETITKYPMRRLDLSIKKFIRVLSIDLERLQKHTLNISRLIKFEDWAGLHKEQVNANRTVQQINVNIKEIEKARRQVISDDLDQFDERVDPVKVEAVKAMEELLAFIGQGPSPSRGTSNRNKACIETGTGDVDLDQLLSSQTGGGKGTSIEMLVASNTSTVLASDFQVKGSNSVANRGSQDVWKVPPSSAPNVQNPDAIDSSNVSSLLVGDMSLTEPVSLLTTTALHVAPENSEATSSWEELQESIMDLNSLVHDFASRVEEQGESVDVIEDHIEHANMDVAEGTTHLSKASKYKAVMFPVVGAVVGGVVGGPIGLLAGMKIGGMAGVIGGAVGLAGGSYFKKRQDKITNIEMSNMSEKRSQSLPEVLDHACKDDDDVDDATPMSSDSIKDQSKSFSLGRVNFGRFASIFSSPTSSQEQ